MGVGTGRRALEISAATPLRHRLPIRTNRSDPSEFDQEALEHLGREISRRRARSRRPHRQRQQEGQFLDDGRHRPVRSVLRTARRSHARRRHATARSSTKATPRCIEIWNLVFIQFNANPDGTFSPLPAKHVDTGMGFERVTAHHPGHEGLHRFRQRKISNYETDIFRPIFDEIEKLSGKKYALDAARSRQHRRRASRKRSTSPSASSPTTSAR